MNPQLQNTLQTLIPNQEKIHSIEKLFGEASYREYFRILTEGDKTYVVMKLAPGKQSISEEITDTNTIPQNLRSENSFLNMARYLNEQGLPVPQVYGDKLKDGLILLQDLGDKTLESLLSNCNEAMRLFFYQQAIDLLVQLQLAGEEHTNENCLAFHRRFDAPLLEWEFEHFLEYGIEDRFQGKIPEEKREELQALGKKLVQEILKTPYTLTHRDFQSRNLMFYGYEFYLLDFQDALQGPVVYDLVALLRDSYIELPWDLVEKLLTYYLQQRKQVGLDDLEEGSLHRQFHLVTLQRKLKDAGRFQFIHTVKKNDKFLPHVPTSLAYVKNALQHLPEYQELGRQLGEWIEDLV